MIQLQIALDEKDVQVLRFRDLPDLINFIENLEDFNRVWIFTTGEDDAEVIVTENINLIICLLNNSVILPNPNLFIQEYKSYEEAYEVALMMQEPKPNCYA
jgi:hypothetical protein